MRRGIEFANFYQPRPWLVLDGDISSSKPAFSRIRTIRGRLFRNRLMS